MKKRDNVKIIDSKTIATLSQKVTQKIDPKYLSKFIKTTVLNSDITNSKNSLYYYTFIESSLSYEILIFENENSKNIILEPFLFLSYYNSNDDTNNVDVFILEDRFILFKNQKFLMLKNVQNVSLSDIEIYISQTYNIKVDNFIEINKEELENLKVDYLKNNYKKIKYTFDNVIDNNGFSFFIIFLAISTLLSFYVIYEKTDNDSLNNTKKDKSSQIVLMQNHYTKLEKIYNKHNLKNVEKTIELFKYLKLQHITLKTFEYKDNKIYLNVVDKEKKKLLDFITVYTENIKIESIKFNETDSTFIMNIFINL